MGGGAGGGGDISDVGVAGGAAGDAVLSQVGEEDVDLSHSFVDALLASHLKPTETH